jgi:hypothetical protein
MADARVVDADAVARVVANARAMEAVRMAELRNRLGMDAPVVAPAPKMAEFLSSELISMAERLGLQWDCPVCMDTKAPKEFILSPCGHRICSGCRSGMEQSSLRRVCPECRA